MNSTNISGTLLCCTETPIRYKRTYNYKAGFLLSLKVDSQEVKVGGLVIVCHRQFEALTPSLKPFFPISIQLRPLSNLCHRRNLTLVKSVCVTAPKSFFWAPACVPGFQYMPRLAQGFQYAPTTDETCQLHCSEQSGIFSPEKGPT